MNHTPPPAANRCTCHLPPPSPPPAQSHRHLTVVSVCQPGRQTGHQRRGSRDCPRRIDHAAGSHSRHGGSIAFLHPAAGAGKESRAHVSRNCCKAPAAMVTCGAASAIAVGTAACLSQGDPAKLRQLPNRDGIRFEVIQQKSHRSGYEHQMELCGAKIVTVETRKELESAINEKTGMMFFLNKAEPRRADQVR